MGETMLHLPIIGDLAPDFEVQTTHGPVRLSDFRGKKWVVMFSHPADFTPVCTTEFIAFASMYDEFLRLNVQLMGLSIDSVHSHLAWVNNLKEKMGVKIPFPIIADLDMKVARLYGMIHEGSSSTATIRAVFFIDDKGVLRAMIYYPLTNGRNIPEIIRLVKALQTTDAHGVATPANWQPGEKVVVPAPATTDAMEKRLKEGYECKEWYLCFKHLE
ncbi:MAG: peroxiredoxin [Methanomicrobiales archaeon]|nr:peroxiredoxin [Methanomicrobiales archaeon]